MLLDAKVKMKQAMIRIGRVFRDIVVVAMTLTVEGETFRLEEGERCAKQR